MLEEQGVVVELNDDFIWVRTKRKSSCQQCSAKSSCGTGALSEYLGRKESDVRVIKNQAVRIGDYVTIGVEETALLTGSLLLYIAPLFMMFSFAIGYEYLSNILKLPTQEFFVILAGLLGLGSGFLLTHFISRQYFNTPHHQAIIIAVQNKNDN